MRYVYLNPQGEEEAFNDPCEKMKENLINAGYELKGWWYQGKFYDQEYAERVRAKQDPMHDVKRWLDSVNDDADRAQLRAWGIQ